MTIVNSHVERQSASTTATGVSTDGNGDVTITVGGLRSIESPADAHAQASGGYTANVQSVDGNSVTVRVFQSAGAADAHAPVTNSDGVTDIHVQATGV